MGEARDEAKGWAPLTQMPVERLARIEAVLTDIDDTLTENGRLPAIAYFALEQLHAAGLVVVPVTGRPAGWCDLIARQWPIDGVVGENGAFYFRYDDAARRMTRRYARSPAERSADRPRLEAIRSEVLTEVAGSAVAADQAYREADLAIDFCEDVPALAEEKVERIVSIFARHGATAKVSSIHVNGWFGRYDKLTTSLRLLRDEFGIDGASDAEGVAYVGDSPNDAPMFGHFGNSVGVANSLRFAETLEPAPAFVTHNEGGKGFAEFASALLAARRQVAGVGGAGL